MPASPSRSHDVAALLEHASVADARQLLEQAPDLVGPFLKSAPHIPEPLLDAVLSSPGPALRALLKNTGAISADRGLRARLCASGHPAVAERARHVDFDLGELRLLMASADPSDARWTASGGPVEALLEFGSFGSVEGRMFRALRACVVSPFPQLVRHILGGALRGPSLTRAELLRAMLSLYTHGGPLALAKTLGEPLPRHTLGDLAVYGHKAVRGEAGVESLAAAVREAEGTSGLIEELYDPAVRAAVAVSTRPAVDWPVVLAAHRERPLPVGAVVALAEREDCSDETVAALCVGHPEASEVVWLLPRPLPLRVLEALPSRGQTRRVLESLVRRSLGHTVSGRHLAYVRPGTAVLELARGARAAGAREQAEWAAFRAELGGLVRDTLSGEVAAWRVVRARMARFRGTVAELLQDAADRAARGEGTAGEWPQAADAPALLESASLRGTRAAFLTLLEAAEPEVQWTLIDHLDGRTRYDLLVLGAWRPQWLGPALGPGRRRERILLSRRDDLPAHARQALAALDDPAPDAGLVP